MGHLPQEVDESHATEPQHGQCPQDLQLEKVSPRVPCSLGGRGLPLGWATWAGTGKRPLSRAQAHCVGEVGWPHVVTGCPPRSHMTEACGPVLGSSLVGVPLRVPHSSAHGPCAAAPPLPPAPGLPCPAPCSVGWGAAWGGAMQGPAMLSLEGSAPARGSPMSPAALATVPRQLGTGDTPRCGHPADTCSSPWGLPLLPKVPP